MKIAAIQHDIVWEDAAQNLARYRDLIKAAADMGARLIVMSEMYSSGSRTPQSPSTTTQAPIS